jgi:predicted Rossmann-fold nucleotide-binding protein
VRKVRGRSLRVEPMAKAPSVDTSGAPVDCYRSSLYTADELYDTPAYADSLDERAHVWALQPPSPRDSLVQALHDHAVDEALTAWLAGRSLVGVMGGHALVRGEAAYTDAARLGALLGRTHTVATGGGPGAMEAANLGGRLAHRPGAALAEALDRLAATPSYRPTVDAWVGTARSVTHLGDSPSLGIPTWFYGHEPSNVFATAIAKYFRNALREAILLQICDAGIVFLPGAAGTVQEVFQDACENYYAAEESVAPMVLVGGSYWTSTVPVWPLLQALARGRPMERHVHLVDTVDDAGELFAG